MGMVLSEISLSDTFNHAHGVSMHMGERCVNLGKNDKIQSIKNGRRELEKKMAESEKIIAAVTPCLAPCDEQKCLSYSQSSESRDSRARLLITNTPYLFFGWRLLSINRSHLF